MSNSDTSSETPEQLIAHINRLMDEAEAMLSGPVAEHAGARLDDIHVRLDRAKSQLENLYDRTRQKITDGARATDRVIRSRPYESLAVALGVGVIVGLLWRRNNQA